MRKFFEAALNYVPAWLRAWYWMYHDPDCPPLTDEQLKQLKRRKPK